MLKRMLDFVVVGRRRNGRLKLILEKTGAPWFAAMPPSLGRGRVTNNNLEKTDG